MNSESLLIRSIASPESLINTLVKDKVKYVIRGLSYAVDQLYQKQTSLERFLRWKDVAEPTYQQGSNSSEQRVHAAESADDLFS
ncbi:MAG TPA: hypothetical protein VFS97_00155 [Nitrososphaeraceae archaeon]|nr:hypothetical protein [Nitrososphaeraceae archaeon]